MMEKMFATSSELQSGCGFKVTNQIMHCLNKIFGIWQWRSWFLIKRTALWQITFQILQRKQLSQWWVDYIPIVLNVRKNVRCMTKWSSFWAVGHTESNIADFFHNFYLTQFRLNLTMVTKFHNFDQISQFRPNFTILTKLNNSDQI